MNILSDKGKSIIISTIGRTIGINIVTILLLSLIGCSTQTTTGNKTSAITIGAILAKPTDYEGQTITITGEYRGWEGGYGTPPVTRSDWVMKDSSGAIYVTGRTPTGYDPNADRGKTITVTATVRLKDGKPYLQVK